MNFRDLQNRFSDLAERISHCGSPCPKARDNQITVWTSDVMRLIRPDGKARDFKGPLPDSGSYVKDYPDQHFPERITRRLKIDYDGNEFNAKLLGSPELIQNGKSPDDASFKVVSAISGTIFGTKSIVQIYWYGSVSHWQNEAEDDYCKDVFSNFLENREAADRYKTGNHCRAPKASGKTLG